MAVVSPDGVIVAVAVPMIQRALALSLLLGVFHSEARDADIENADDGTLVGEFQTGGPLDGRISVYSTSREVCGWEDPPEDKTVSCDGTYTESTPSAYFIWQLSCAVCVTPVNAELDYVPIDITATAGEDYTASSGSLTIPAGGFKSRREYVQFIDDSKDEPNETMAYEITVVSGPVSAADYIAFEIEDNDPEPSLSISDAAADENAGALSFEVSISAASGKQITVDYATADGTATAPSDYTAKTGRVTIEPGDTMATVSVSIVDDTVAELDETMTVTLSNAANATLGTDATGTGTIQDTALAAVSVTDASGLEDTVGNLAFVVTVSRALVEGGSVQYATSNGTATAGADYTSMNGTLTFSPGDTSMTVNVPVTADAAVEPDETLTLVLSDATNLQVRGGAATGTIGNDDFELAIVESREGPERGRLVFPVTLRGDGMGRTTVSVDYATASLTATEDIDYSQESGTLTFPSGVSERSITVLVRQDNITEVDEQFEVVLSKPVGAVITTAKSTATILDDDQPEVTVDDATASEGAGRLSFAVRLSAPTGAAVTVDYETGDFTAIAGADYVARDDTLTFASGETVKNIDVTVIDDNASEDDERLDLKLTGAENANLVMEDVVACPFPAEENVVACAVGTIEDDDTVPTLSVADATVSEGEGALSFVVTVADLEDPNLEVTVRYATSDGTASSASDYESASGTLTFTSTEASRTIAVNVNDDRLDEAAETLTLTLSEPSNAELSDASATGTIEDDDEASTGVTLTVSPPRVREDAGPTEVEVTATLDASARSEVTAVTVSVSGSGEADAVDFEEVSSFAVTIPAGRTSGAKTFTLTPEDDEVDEVDETVLIGGASDLDVTGTSVDLADDDATSTGIELSASPKRVVESGGAVDVTVTATLDGGAGTSTRTVSVSVMGSGEADAVDFSEVAGFDIAIAAGKTSGTGTFALTPEDDLLDEMDETVTIAGTSDLPVASASVVLADDDEPPTAVILTVSPERLSEGDGTREVEVTAALDRGALAEDLAVRVTVTGVAGTGAVGFEATPSEFEVTIAAAATTGSGTFAVTPEDDEVDEVDEALAIAGSSDLPVTSARVALADDDAASTLILLTASPATISEGAGPTEVEVTATLDAGARLEATEVEVTVTGSGVTEAVDFAPVEGLSLTIDAGETSGTGTFTLTPDDDGVAESNETLAVEGTADVTVNGASVTLVDDDAASTGIVLSASPSRWSEGGGAVEVRVTAALNRAARQEATSVTVSVSGSGVADASDFTPVADFEVTIPAGLASGEGAFTLAPEDDAVTETDETLTLTGNSGLPVSETTVTLADDDEASAAIILSAAPSRLTEGAGATLVTVTASLDRGRRQAPTAVRVSVSGSGVADAVDFTPIADFEVTIPAGSASGEGAFTLVPESDTVTETDETLTLTGASDLPVTATDITLADDDAASTRVDLSVRPARVSEGAGPTAVEVTATLDGGLRRRATAVRVSVSGSGVAHASDFAPVADFEVTIPAGSASGAATFTVVPEDDREVEADETLSVTGTSDLPVRSVSLVLADDDEVSTRILLYLSVSPPQALEGDGPVKVTVTAAVDRAVRAVETRIGVTVSASGDPRAVDFAPVADFEVVIPANALEGMAEFTLTPEDDLVVERDETVTVSGSSDLPVTPTTLRLLDDDVAAVRLSASPGEVSEGDGQTTVTVTATLTGSIREEATKVTVTVTASGDPDAVDFAPVRDFAITVAAGATAGEASFTLAPEDDGENESDETVTIGGVSDIAVTATSVTIVDDDQVIATSLAVADAVAAEGDSILAFEVTLSARSTTEVTVRYATADGTAEAGSDYESAEGTFMFAPGEVLKTIRVALIDDALHEPDETLGLDLSQPRNATLARASAVGTIVDDDELPLLSVADALGTEADGELVFAVTLSAPTDGAVTLEFATSDVTAEAGTDYVSADGTLTLAAGETAATIRVEVLDDALDEADEETFAVTLSGIGGARAGDVSALGTLVDDDSPPRVSVADAAGDEAAGPLMFVVSLDSPSAREVTADYATADATATAGTDYEAVSGTLAFAPGTVSGTVVVPVLDDSGHEADETFLLELSRPRNAVLAVGTGEGTIRDDDLSPPTLTVALPDAALCVGGVPFELDLSAYFAGEEVRFSASSSAPAVATATVPLSASRLVIAPVSEGAATVTVTASNEAGEAESVVEVRVVTDPAELAAVDGLLASIGRSVLIGVANAVGDRFALRNALTNRGGASEVTSDFGGMGEFDESGFVGAVGAVAPPASLADFGNPYSPSGLIPVGHEWIGTGAGPSRYGMPTFSFAAPAGGDPGSGLLVWGRGEQHRFEGRAGGASHAGTLTGVHLGVDVGGDDWLGGVAVLHGRTEAEYGFARSVDACGGGPDGNGTLDAELTGVHPYGGRRVGRGWLWAAFGAGRGDISAERCELGHMVETDLSMRLAAVGGRHPFGGGERVAVSVVEDLGVVELTTGSAVHPIGDRSVTAGYARVGLEAAGVAPPGCECSLATYVRAYARRDWGDGAAGAGLELAAGVRFESVPRRLGLDVGVRGLAAHSGQDIEERGAHLAVSLLPAANGSGWRAMLAWRRGTDHRAHGSLDGLSPWSALAGRPATGDWAGELHIGYGFVTRHGMAVPFLELDAGRGSPGGSRLGMRHEIGSGARGAIRVEWGVEYMGSRAGNADTRWIVMVSGRM